MAPLRAAGFSEEDACVEARRAFGNVTRAEENFYEWGRWRALDEVLLNRLNVLQFVASSKHFAGWKQRSTMLQDAALYSVADANDLGGDEPRHVQVAQITANLPALMGAVPQLGRSFAVNEDQPGHDSVAMIGSQLWHEQFGADPNVCGRTIRLNGIPFSIVGVLPPGFDFPSGVQIWTPTIHSFQRLTQSGAFFVSIVARMNPGVTPE
jgi:hypothetical protein